MITADDMETVAKVIGDKLRRPALHLVRATAAVITSNPDRQAHQVTVDALAGHRAWPELVRAQRAAMAKSMQTRDPMPVQDAAIILVVAWAESVLIREGRGAP